MTPGMAAECLAVMRRAVEVADRPEADACEVAARACATLVLLLSVGHVVLPDPEHPDTAPAPAATDPWDRAARRLS